MYESLAHSSTALEGYRGGIVLYPGSVISGRKQPIELGLR